VTPSGPVCVLLRRARLSHALQLLFPALFAFVPFHFSTITPIQVKARRFWDAYPRRMSIKPMRPVVRPDLEDDAVRVRALQRAHVRLREIRRMEFYPF
jgi:hypothetical protein